MQLAGVYGGPPDDPEAVTVLSACDERPVTPPNTRLDQQKPQEKHTAGVSGTKTMTLHLGNGHTIALRNVDAGLWMSACEINE